MDSPLLLVVDADPATRDMYDRLLLRCGFRVLLAASAVDAMAAAQRWTPDLITTDLGFDSGGDGCQMTQDLKADDRTKTIPIVAVTAWTDAAPMAQAWAAGCDAVLAKPCELATLLAVVQALLGESLRLTGSDALTVDSPAASTGRRPQMPSHVTFSPPQTPPLVRCPTCDDTLNYQRSVLSRVDPPEQWDFYRCRRCRERFEYRQRTFKLKFVGEADSRF